MSSETPCLSLSSEPGGDEARQKYCVPDVCSVVTSEEWRDFSLKISDVTVVVATLNSADLLAYSIPSWLATPVARVIVVDGGSTDGSISFLRSISTATGRVDLVNEPRKGLAVARNSGSRRAKTKVLLHAGPDNLISSETLEAMLAELISADLVSCRTRVATGSTIRDAVINLSKSRLRSGADLPVVGTPYMARKGVFLSYPFDESIRDADDTFFCETLRSNNLRVSRIDEHCLETGFETFRSLKERYWRWGRSDAEYFLARKERMTPQRRFLSFTRSFWVEITVSPGHAGLWQYLIGLPFLVLFGTLRFRSFLYHRRNLAPSWPAT